MGTADNFTEIATDGRDATREHFQRWQLTVGWSLHDRLSSRPAACSPQRPAG